MKKPLMLLAAVLFAGGVATAQITGCDKAPKNHAGTVTTDAHADPRGSDEYKTAAKHKGRKKGHKNGKAEPRVSTDVSTSGAQDKPVHSTSTRNLK